MHGVALSRETPCDGRTRRRRRRRHRHRQTQKKDHFIEWRRSNRGYNHWKRHLRLTDRRLPERRRRRRVPPHLDLLGDLLHVGGVVLRGVGDVDYAVGRRLRVHQGGFWAFGGLPQTLGGHPGHPAHDPGHCRVNFRAVCGEALLSGVHATGARSKTLGGRLSL